VKFEIYIDKDKLYHFSLRVSDGEVIMWSTGYPSEEYAINTAQWVRDNVSFARIVSA